ncbi:transposase (plasmid) [Arthrobacter sp. Hiyo8]|nr:transposase [Arthrobacter sp. Hiyo8]
MLALHLLQSSLVLVNTLMLQTVLEVPEFNELLEPEDRRGLTPLFWTHINPYGRFTLDMTTHLNLGGGQDEGSLPASVLSLKEQILV